MKEQDSKKTSTLSFLEHPTTKGRGHEDFSFYNYLSAKNILIGFVVIAVITALIKFTSTQVVLLSSAIMALVLFLAAEIKSRRKWEDDVNEKLDQVNSDYERLVREVARTRQNTENVSKKIADAAGDFVRSYDKSYGKADIERRILKSLAMQLADLGDNPRADKKEPIIVIDPAIAEKQSSLKGISDVEVGRRLNDDQVVQLLKAALKKDGIDLFLQPVVNLPQRKVRFYETYARIKVISDIYLPAARYLDLALKHNLMQTIDNMLLLRGLQEVRKSAEGDYNYAFFFNITSSTLNDSKFMGDLVEFISQNRMLAPQLVFELGQPDLFSMSPDIYPALDGLAKLGCRFSMDSVEQMQIDFHYLDLRHIRFIKIKAAMLLKFLKKEDGLTKLKTIKEEMDRNGIDLIVENVEKERDLIELLDLDIDYGQGYLFGKPQLCEK